MTGISPKDDGAKIHDGAKTRGAAKLASAPWTEIVMVCAKCAKRQGVGAKAVRRGLKQGAKRLRGGGRLRVVEVGCLGLCPKRSLTLASGASLRDGRLLVFDPAADPAAMLAALLPGAAADAP
ncbi:(2Fe-2S) ferredoxin domain-containing protein [uncultured Methylobacterium sp.]|uniref:(2Fe-2S) ferredoxin domain-containing protein n=1 Tax=uncultured Methylobacterium sp. TaxID=157278 RepID=UPI0026074350|nr:(2Fe-2S) ferredoxin domain-containing protein [uncultured Methylobacterium sp.]